MKSEKVTANRSYKTYPYRKASLKSKHYLSKREYHKVVRAVNESMLEYCLETGMEAYIPSSMGSYQIFKFKPVKPKIDVGHLMKTGQKIYHENMHTDGFAVEFRWQKNWKTGFKGKRMWIFELARNKNRYEHNSLVQYVKRNGVDKYFQR
jgi:hypothetical protein